MVVTIVLSSLSLLSKLTIYSFYAKSFSPCLHRILHVIYWNLYCFVLLKMNRTLQTLCSRVFTRPLLNLSPGLLPMPGINFVPCAGTRHHKLTDQQMRLRYKKLHWHKFYDDKWVQRRGGGSVDIIFQSINYYSFFLDGMKR